MSALCTELQYYIGILAYCTKSWMRWIGTTKLSQDFNNFRDSERVLFEHRGKREPKGKRRNETSWKNEKKIVCKNVCNTRAKVEKKSWKVSHVWLQPVQTVQSASIWMRTRHSLYKDCECQKCTETNENSKRCGSPSFLPSSVDLMSEPSTSS